MSSYAAATRIVLLLLSALVAVDPVGATTGLDASERPADRVEADDAAHGPHELSMDQRRAFLRYYAPILLKRADEDKGDHQGHDWITNAFFDGDTDLANNKRQWNLNLEAWSDDAGFSHWSLRPTLYTAIIEFMEGPHKSVILLYHVYHAKQRASIHDWERIELRLDGVRGDPGQGERLAYAVVTQHSRHNARPVSDLSFHRTDGGEHLLVWQAQWSGVLGFIRGELRFVEDGMDRLEQQRDQDAIARVDVNGGDRTAFHYVFVPQDDGDAVDDFQATRLSQANARSLAARRSRRPVRWGQVKRITYELQDMADLLPTYLDERSWRGGTEIALSSAVLHEDGSQAIPSSPQGGSTTFLYQANDDEDEDESRSGYPRKHWFWGTYFFDRTVSILDGSWTGNWQEGLEGPVPQHDYFAHNGVQSSGDHRHEEMQSGRWLLDRDGWWRASRGGFDGRWVALFPD